tara:strand:- start:10797 stop:11270 length:474 start_codon:yes stop_codon:yes gene_type:complete
MSSAAQPYPGEISQPLEILALAEEYRQAATALRGQLRTKQPLSTAPFRLCAIQSIELFLNSFLLQSGMKPREIRALQHDMQRRAELSTNNGLALRKKTADHLETLANNREYLISRYEPAMVNSVSEINRLLATMEEVANKVQKHSDSRASISLISAA